MINSILALLCIQYNHVLYQWSGNVTYSERLDAVVADCSGFVLKVLHDAGITLPDMTAQDIYDWCITKKGFKSELTCDSLLFFGKDSENITHVAIAINKDFMYESAGAGRNSLEMSKEELIARSAGVRIRRIDSRSDLIEAITIEIPNRRE